MRGAAGSGRPDDFFLHLNNALQERIALSVGRPGGSFTVDVIHEQLIPAGLGDEEAIRLRALLERIAEARFSPDSSAAELSELLAEAEFSLTALERLSRRA